MAHLHMIKSLHNPIATTITYLSIHGCYIMSVYYKRSLAFSTLGHACVNDCNAKTAEPCKWGRGERSWRAHRSYSDYRV